MSLRYAYAAVDITPQAGAILEGYEEMRVPIGVHDNLFLKILFLEAEDSVALIAVDSLCVNRRFCSMLADTVRRKSGIRSVIVGATHSHSAFAGCVGPSILGKERSAADFRHLMDSVSRKLEEGISWLKGDAHFSSLATTPVGSNRIIRAGYFHPVLSSLVVGDYPSRYVFASYPCHATTLPPSNLFVSRDYPGYFVDALERDFRVAGAMFVNGFAGNVSTRFTRLGQNFAEAERSGAVLASAFASRPKGEPLADSVRTEELRLNLKRREMKSQSELLEELEKEERIYGSMGHSDPLRRVSYTRMQGIRIEIKNISALSGVRGFISSISFVTIGNLKLVALPSEPFNEFADIINGGSERGGIMPLGYSNDYTGYWPFTGGYTGDSYEFHSAFVSQSSVDEAVEAARSMVAGL